ncbi:DUF5954 family protein [Streptomyces zaomyceticus]|uniref:DUF5954 family protein n=1 Tax=Streptomyces zaomyceticus TaxID=68286 RepID=UPI00371E315A
MSEEDARLGEWPLLVRIPVEPVEAAVEADALAAAARYGALAVRGPLFGVATQDGGRRWRVVIEVTHSCPQQACDALNEPSSLVTGEGCGEEQAGAPSAAGSGRPSGGGVR